MESAVPEPVESLQQPWALWQDAAVPQPAVQFEPPRESPKALQERQASPLRVEPPRAAQPVQAVSLRELQMQREPVERGHVQEGLASVLPLEPQAQPQAWLLSPAAPAVLQAQPLPSAG